MPSQQVRAMPDSAPQARVRPKEEALGNTSTSMWKRSDPESAIYLPRGEDDLCNQQVVGIVTRAETYLVTWTTASVEGATDQRVLVSRSTNRGKNWSGPQTIDLHTDAAPGAASYSSLYQVPETGRIYIFYIKGDRSFRRARKDVTGYFAWKYSDDDGISWQDVSAKFNMGRGEWTPADPSLPSDWIGIYSPHATRTGDVLFSFARYGLKDNSSDYANWMTEVLFLRLDNIRTEPDPEKLTFSIFPKGPRGLRIERDNGMFWGNEPSWIELSDGRLVAAIRTRNDAVYFTVSEDVGRTWTPPEPMRHHDGGEPILNPSAPCPMVKLRDGRIVLMYYNQKQNSTFGPRNPVYLAVGRENLAALQPIEFALPKKFMEVTGPPPRGTTYVQIASYSSLVEHDGELLLFYNDCKHWVLFKRVPQDLLSFDPPLRSRGFEDRRTRAPSRRGRAARPKPNVGL